MTLKMNSLQDMAMIDRLYLASDAGVRINLIIRGICVLVPGRKGYSENIHGVSIVDRYLEHARVFHFHHAGEELVYLSSADFMTRNLSHRVETTFPIYDEEIKDRILEILDIQLADNVKARLLSDQQANTYYRGGSDLSIRSQKETYHLIKRSLCGAVGGILVGRIPFVSARALTKGSSAEAGYRACIVPPRSRRLSPTRPRNTAMISATTAAAISSGVSAPMSKPMGV